MKKYLILLSTVFFIASCGNNNEIEILKKENSILTKQIEDLQQGRIPVKTKYILRLHLQQSHISLNIKKHIKDYTNSIDFEIPVDKEYFDSLEIGSEIVDKFRFGSFVLYGSFGDWEMTVKDKVIK